MYGLGPNPISQALAAGVVARRLATRGDLKSAVALLGQALHLAPQAPLLETAEGWLTHETLATLGVRPLRRLAFAMARVAAAMPPRAAGHDGRLSNLHAGLRILSRGRACYPDDQRLFVGEAFVRSKLGDSKGEHFSALAALFGQATVAAASSSG